VGVAWYCEAPSPLLRVCAARGGLVRGRGRGRVRDRVRVRVRARVRIRDRVKVRDRVMVRVIPTPNLRSAISIALDSPRPGENGAWCYS